MKEEPIDNQEQITPQNTILNLLAIGGFLWFFLKSFKYLVYACAKSIGIISETPPSASFWTAQILSIISMGIVAIILTRRIWNKYLQNALNSRSQLIKLGIGIFVIQALQFIYGFYMPDYLYDHHQNAVLSYNESLNSIDQFGLIGTSFSLGGTILLLLVFVKWK